MGKKSSESSQRAKQVSVSAQCIFNKPVGKRQQALQARIAKRQQSNDESLIDFSEIPELTAEQLRKA
jgi:hypothetical protein